MQCPGSVSDEVVQQDPTCRGKHLTGRLGQRLVHSALFV